MTRHLQTQFNMEGKTGWKSRNNKIKKGFKSFYIYELITRKYVWCPAVRDGDAVED